MFGMTATEFVLLNNTDRDALREPWRVRPLFARCALELQENDKVGVTVFGLGKLPYTYLAPANISSVLQTFLDASTVLTRAVASSPCCLPRHELA